MGPNIPRRDEDGRDGQEDGAVQGGVQVERVAPAVQPVDVARDPEHAREQHQGAKGDCAAARLDGYGHAACQAGGREGEEDGIGDQVGTVAGC